MSNCLNAILLVALAVLAQQPAFAQGTQRPFWVCVGADGARKAQDSACDVQDQTVSAPPGAVSTPPSVQPAAAIKVDGNFAAVQAPSPADGRPDPFKPIMDVAVKGFGVTAVILLAIGAIKVLVIKATTRKQGGRSNRRSSGQPNRRASNPSSRNGEAASPARDPYEAEPDAPSRPAPSWPARSEQPADAAPAPLTWNIALIRELEWKRFEELCMQFWHCKGYPARLSGPGADGGVDVLIADRRDPGKIFAVAQCKSWSSKPVGVESVRALWGAKDHFKANLALFYGLSGFTPDARAFAEGKHLKLISGEELLQQIMALTAPEQAALLATITHGDYTTPTCPACDIKMHRRTGKDGKPDFWGCNNFRRCGSKPIPLRG